MECTLDEEGDCDVNIDECASNACKNGAACTDADAGYSCACALGWQGDNCEVRPLDPRGARRLT
jgi:Notch-like protein